MLEALHCNLGKLSPHFYMAGSSIYIITEILESIQNASFVSREINVFEEKLIVIKHFPRTNFQDSGKCKFLFSNIKMRMKQTIEGLLAF